MCCKITCAATAKPKIPKFDSKLFVLPLLSFPRKLLTEKEWKIVFESDDEEDYYAAIDIIELMFDETRKMAEAMVCRIKKKPFRYYLLWDEENVRKEEQRILEIWKKDPEMPESMYYKALHLAEDNETFRIMQIIDARIREIEKE